MMQKSIMVVDDYQESRNTLGEIFSTLGCQVKTASSGEEAIKVVKTSNIDIVYLDQNMPEMDGFETLQVVKNIKPEIIVYFITGYADLGNAIKAMKMGAIDYLVKPLSLVQIQNSLKHAIQLLNANRSDKKTVPDLDKGKKNEVLLGEHSYIQRVLKDISLVAPTNYSVLVLGESGTGKELVAKEIHKQSLRQKKPFIPVNSSAIPENILESELFGHEKGAFTDAGSTKKGLFETANNGTLFMDEIGTLPVTSQAKILRVIEEKKILKVGGIKPIDINIRFVFATNRDLEEAVSENKFREDLYYRIAELIIFLPPLRKRGDDVLLLSNIFLEEISQSLNKSLKLSDQAKKSILNYKWPGNIRELKNRLKMAALITDGTITPDQLFISKCWVNQSKTCDNKDSLIENALNGKISYNQAVQQFEKSLLNAAMEKTGNKKGRAASLLQLYTTSFIRKLKNNCK